MNSLSRYFNGSRNQFTKFPVPLCQAGVLEEVNLSWNQIAEVTFQVSELTDLAVLNLANNQFLEFPQSVRLFSSYSKIITHLISFLNLFIGFFCKWIYWICAF